MKTLIAIVLLLLTAPALAEKADQLAFHNEPGVEARIDDYRLSFGGTYYAEDHDWAADLGYIVNENLTVFVSYLKIESRSVSGSVESLQLVERDSYRPRVEPISVPVTLDTGDQEVFGLGVRWRFFRKCPGRCG